MTRLLKESSMFELARRTAIFNSTSVHFIVRSLSDEIELKLNFDMLLDLAIFK